ncbi:hypothetical protein C3B58_18005 [Lactonifactor longoviformis]|uniref:Uncharacterized protein n=1 Tax=Lactonifactor longoviformis DSM 17459 TaxID=1122155 RepID=A0A1M4WZY6_9CLOT|nr:hypothetical protein [Lactonifactor longoviformis]POP31104.1 hypothetical protein C3B58_18005 [Lactonifactor longoviformis]SHE86809.1 hypothetical protein SAMN02745158_01822 [Lactonifactor longoviformis DSM 17459]
MRNERWRKHKVIIIAAAAALGVTGTAGILAVYGQNLAERRVAEEASESLTEGVIEEIPYYRGWNDSTLYRDAVEDQEIVKEVCTHFGLDYETVTMKDITKDMRNYEEALNLKKDLGDNPLLSENAKEGVFTLEVYISDVYAFDGGGQVIKKYCETLGLDASLLKVSDLSLEDLIKIGELAYETSDHPK